ncbi:PQQ-binding-like beta-propeller repeat protein (plasmid) [Halococcus dombrowskii]|jgi:alcohol dehydrogenase (cytochrome c)|uniref:PQQ-binding-like beta-propeller repeat protein n=1 Tax=Halococcus dombrowskii TaxID=179637 RepID=A0AAV3SL87_HALDO|nr:PQQ-binding-like beta-propeller repeat protein [Halococcus dombrowskii]UOO97012.1 PQQ-binding-like beta-propeller repeat protein [Halococcus dombrowskii]
MAIEEDKAVKAAAETIVEETELGYQVFDAPDEAVLDQTDTDRIPEVEVTQEMLTNAGEDPESWLMFGNNYEQHRHTTADIITPENVTELEVEYDLEVGANSSMEGSPVIVPGDPPIMYQTNGPSHVKAIDAREGDILWSFTFPAPDDAVLCCDDNNRGVAVWKDTIYMTTLDSGVQALNRYTGEEEWYASTADHKEGYSATWAPIIYDGVLFTGSAGGEYGVRGFHCAFDAETGEELWRMNPCTEDEYVGDSIKQSGGTNWMTATFDTERELLYINVGNPSPDFNGTVRPGPNRNTCSTLCLDPETGEIQWAHQESSHDIWDYDSASVRMLIRDLDIPHLDEHTDVVYNAGKTSWGYTMDADTGELLVRSRPLTQQINMMKMVPHVEEERDYVMLPGLLGGQDWQPPSYSPETGLCYHKLLNTPHNIQWRNEEYKPGEKFWGGIVDVEPEEERIPDEWNGHISAIVAMDPATGKIAWRDWIDSDRYLWGGTMTTSTGLLFAGTQNGNMIAYDAENGERLWEFDLSDKAVSGDPVSWYDPGSGKQYIAIQVGGSGFVGRGPRGDRLVVFSLEE